MGHWISFGITLAMMVVIITVVVYSLKKRPAKLGFIQRYGPLICTIIAAPLIMADLTRHVLQDTNIWKECERQPGEIWGDNCLWSSSQYRCTLPSPHCIPDDQENMAHLSPMGIVFTIIFTYVGFIFLTIGTLWNANIVSKIRQIKKQWILLRSQM
jgi:hypothetical protein